MNIFKKKNLVNNYKAELENLEFMKDDGDTQVSTETFNFIGELDENNKTTAAMSQGMSYKDKVESFWKKQNLTITASAMRWRGLEAQKYQNTQN